MSLTTQSVNSIELVQPEIDSTIQQAEDSLSRFVDNRDDGEALQNCIDCLNQLRGIYILVEIQGCVLLCQQAVALANEVPVGASDDKNELLSSLSNSIFVLRRYTEYFGADKNDHPELLLPVINELRAAVHEKPYPESHFFDIDTKTTFDVFSVLDPSLSSALDNFEHHARRFRHMYQVGLLDLLRDQNRDIALKLIDRAAKGSARLCAGEPLAELWGLASVVTESIQQQSMDINDSRKRMFMRLERYLREMAMAGKVVAAKSAPDSLKKDLLYLLALSGGAEQNVTAILYGFGVQELDISESKLREEAKRLFGPGIDVLRSLSKAINEEMAFLKEKLDVFERGTSPDPEDLEFIAEGLKRLGGTLLMLDLKATSERCNDIHAQVSAWQESSEAVAEDQLLAVADGILTIEAAIARYEETGEEANLDEVAAGPAGNNAYLTEARIVVVDEAISALVLTKRAISSFIESKGDKLHLANVAPVMETIAGGMLMIAQDRVAGLIKACSACIKSELLENESMPDQTLLETLADALSSLEYYIESMNYKDASNTELLRLSEESLSSIGHAPSTES